MKKIAGLLFIVLAVFFSFFLLTRIPNLVRTTVRALSGGAYEIGRFFGSVFFLALVAVGVYFLFKYGLKWMKGRPFEKNETLDAHFIDEEEREV